MNYFFKFPVTQLRQPFIEILEDAILESRTHLSKDYEYSFSKARRRRIQEDRTWRRALWRAQYPAAGRLRKGWRVKASKGRWGDAAQKGGGMEDAARKSGDMEEPSVEALVQASLILVVAIAIIISNFLIIITYLNFRGKVQRDSVWCFVQIKMIYYSKWYYTFDVSTLSLKLFYGGSIYVKQFSNLY